MMIEDLHAICRQAIERIDRLTPDELMAKSLKLNGVINVQHVNDSEDNHTDLRMSN